jgi:hypothetical protein
MQKITISKLDGNRVETGSVEFTYPATEQQKKVGMEGRTDWSGYYIRGDDFCGLAIYFNNLEQWLKTQENIPIDLLMIKKILGIK